MWARTRQANWRAISSIESGRIVKSWDDRKDCCSRIRCPVHIADVNLVQRSLADAKHKRPLFFQTNVSGALDEMSGEAIRNFGQSTHRAWHHDHGAGRVGTAGDIGADVGITLQGDLG